MNGNLILSRKEGESVTLLKDGLPLATVKCRNRDVLTINADSGVQVLRSELLKPRPRPGTDGQEYST